MNLSLPAFTFSAVFFSLLIFPPHHILRAGEPIVLTSPAGKSIRAEILAVDTKTKKVQYRRVKDGRIFVSKISIFDVESQDRLSSVSFVNNAAQQQLRLTAKATHKRAAAPADSHSDQPFYRTIIELENRSAEEFTALKIDIVVVKGFDAETGSFYEERQSYPIRRIKGAGEIQVQTRIYEVPGGDVKGAAIRLRDADTGATVFEWKAMPLSSYDIVWMDEADREALATR